MVGRSSAESSTVEQLDVDELPAGTALMNGAYTIEKFLNAGGFGMTYVARDSLNRRVVIKECFPGAFCRRKDNNVQPRSRGHQEELKSVVTLFVNEAKALARLDHPGIVAVHQVFEENNTAYMALDFVQGRDLLDILIDQDIKLNEQDIEAILRKLLEAIGFIHEAGLLHRDISPDNILIDDDLNPVLIDFGAAREQATKKTRVMSALRVVKDGYSPQEFYIGGSEQGPFSDLYSLGACFYHLLTNDIPPDGQVRIAALASGDEDPYRPLVDRVQGFREDFLKAIDKALAVLPKDRVRSAAQWLQLMEGQKIGPQRVTQLEIMRSDDEGGAAETPAALQDVETGASDAAVDPNEPMVVRRATRPVTKAAPATIAAAEAIIAEAAAMPAEPSPAPQKRSTPVLGKILASAAAIGIIGVGIASQTDLMKDFSLPTLASLPSLPFETETTVVAGGSTAVEATDNAPATLPAPTQDAVAPDVSGGSTAVAGVEDAPVTLPAPTFGEGVPTPETELAAIANSPAVIEAPAEVEAAPAPEAEGSEDVAVVVEPATDAAPAAQPEEEVAGVPALSPEAIAVLTTTPVPDGPIFATWTVALPDGMTFDAEGGADRVLAVNGVPVESRDAFDAVLMNSIDPGSDRGIEIVITSGTSASDSVENVVDLAVVHSVDLAGGLRFETTHDGSDWKTFVAGLPETNTLDLAVNDRILAFLNTSELVDGVETLPAILERERAAEASTLVFAVQRDGENWAIAMPAEALFVGAGG